MPHAYVSRATGLDLPSNIEVNFSNDNGEVVSTDTYAVQRIPQPSDAQVEQLLAELPPPLVGSKLIPLRDSKLVLVHQRPGAPPPRVVSRRDEVTVRLALLATDAAESIKPGVNVLYVNPIDGRALVIRQMTLVLPFAKVNDKEMFVLDPRLPAQDMLLLTRGGTRLEAFYHGDLVANAKIEERFGLPVFGVEFEEGSERSELVFPFPWGD